MILLTTPYGVTIHFHLARSLFGTFLLTCALIFARITYPAPQIPKHLSRRLHFHLPQFIFVLCVVLGESVDESCGVTIEINPP